MSLRMLPGCFQKRAILHEDVDALLVHPHFRVKWNVLESIQGGIANTRIGGFL